MLACLRSDVISVLVQKTFDWGGEIALSGEGVRTGRQFTSKQVFLKKPWFQDKHRGTLEH